MLISDLNRYIVSEVHGCADLMIENAIRQAIIELCEQSACWQHISEVPLDDCVSEYMIYIPKFSRLVFIKDISLQDKGYALEGSTISHLNYKYRGWQTMQGMPRFFIQLDNKSFKVIPKPHGFCDMMTVLTSLAPTINATEIDDEIGERYYETIANGAKAKLMVIPNVAWSNPQLATYYHQQFKQGIGQARLIAEKDNTRANLKIELVGVI